MPLQITCASALPGKTENTKIAFSLKCCISALLEFNRLISSIFLTHNSYSRSCMTPQIMQSMRSAHRAVDGMIQEKGSRKRRRSWTLFSNTSAKNYCNWIVYVKTIASQRWDVFLRHSVVSDTIIQVNSKV